MADLPVLPGVDDPAGRMGPERARVRASWPWLRSRAGPTPGIPCDGVGGVARPSTGDGAKP